MEIRVSCYAGHRGEETPGRFWLGERKVKVLEVVDRWLDPEHRYFKVVGDDGAGYILRHDVRTWRWDLVFYKRTRRTDTMQIFISGSLAYDRIMNFPGIFSDHILPDKLDILNVAFNVNGLSERFGGTAGNIAYNLGLLDEKPVIVATAGKDFDRYDSWLKENGLSTYGIRIVEEEFTAGAYITTDESDNQITCFNVGAMGHSSGVGFGDVAKDPALAIISPGSTDDMNAYSAEFKELGIPYIFDPGQSIPVLSGEEITEMITGARMLISNDYELELIQQKTGLDRTGILERTPVLVTTLGEKGSRIVSAEGEDQVPTVPADQVVDPTGAGDAYRAGLIKGMITGKTLGEAARMGAVCASFAVARRGTQEHAFTLEAFRKRYQQAFGSDCLE
jgi:adenosine kinase